MNFMCVVQYFLFLFSFNILKVFLIGAALVIVQVKVVLEPERIVVFLTRSCVQLTDISCGVVYEASFVLF